MGSFTKHYFINTLFYHESEKSMFWFIDNHRFGPCTKYVDKSRWNSNVYEVGSKIINKTRWGRGWGRGSKYKNVIYAWPEEKNRLKTEWIVKILVKTQKIIFSKAHPAHLLRKKWCFFEEMMSKTGNQRTSDAIWSDGFDNFRSNLLYFLNTSSHL